MERSGRDKTRAAPFLFKPSLIQTRQKFPRPGKKFPLTGKYCPVELGVGQKSHGPVLPPL
jgi:hypothetical protein